MSRKCSSKSCLSCLLLFISLCITAPFSVQGQSFEQHYKQAIDLRLSHKFPQSDSLFKSILKNHKKNLPEALCYHYGVVLFELKDSTKAKLFFKKYLSFKKNNHTYKDSTMYYLHRMDVKVELPLQPKTTSYIDTCDVCHGKGISTQDCHKCAGSGRVLCYVCHGRGVLGNPNEMGTTQKFTECHQCKGVGTLSCAVCKGTKTVVDTCIKCKGKGKIIISK